MSMAVLMAAVALLIGIALGYTARTGEPPPPVQTIEREVSVVTVPVEP